jgi:hypothetical protein
MAENTHLNVLSIDESRETFPFLADPAVWLEAALTL